MTNLSRLPSIALQVAVTAVSWLALYHLNSVLFSAFNVDKHVSWVFLPAAIRLFAVLVFGLPGAAGLFIGSLLQADLTSAVKIFHSVMYAVLSAGGPVLALAICLRGLRLEADLRGLRPDHLVVFSLMGAVCNVIPNRLYIWLTGAITGPLVDAVPMFVGDSIGTVLMLYFSGALLRVLTSLNSWRER